MHASALEIASSECSTPQKQNTHTQNSLTSLFSIVTMVQMRLSLRNKHPLSTSECLCHNAGSQLKVRKVHGKRTEHVNWGADVVATHDAGTSLAMDMTNILFEDRVFAPDFGLTSCATKKASKELEMWHNSVVEEHCLPLQDGGNHDDVDELPHDNVFSGSVDGFDAEEDKDEDDDCKCHDHFVDFFVPTRTWVCKMPQMSAEGGWQFLSVVFVTRFPTDGALQQVIVVG